MQTNDLGDAQAFDDKGVKTFAQFDSLGRTVYTRMTDTNPGEYVFAKMLYLRDNTSGSRELASVPYRAAAVRKAAGFFMPGTFAKEQNGRK